MHKLPNLEDAAARYILGEEAAQEIERRFYPADGFERAFQVLFEQLKKGLRHEDI